MAHWEHRPDPRCASDDEKQQWEGYTRLLEQKALVRAKAKAK